LDGSRNYCFFLLDCDQAFSGWIRLEMLKMIKEQAEGYAACPEK